MQKIGNYIALGFLWLFSLQPFFMLYIFSDILYHVIRLIGYRRAVINENLRYAFPDKSKDEIRNIRLKFYKGFCDSMIETIKLQTISEKQMRKHVRVKNVEYLNKLADEGKDAIGVMGHYSCWEWVPSLNLHTKHLACATYRPLVNVEFDKYMLKLREKWGNLNFTMRDTMREIVKLKRKDQRFLIGLIADQSPDKNKIQYWTEFLNQNTAVLLGPEKMAKALKSPVVFLKMTRLKRSYYEIEVIPLVEKPELTEDYEVTEIHLKCLEGIIKERPEDWLWSHKRWKYSEVRELNTKPNA
ncbi:lysophospholipid acyltransferase family protein [Carboxylicivirga sp. M1479]|uniref:lysophospholipid acyltransferase family protein n=1 Tax=Carboxylicivirga sp. M1479 TaxID=2594476 RepID=UPI001178B256|nr:lysophospholipid acyltransferase family protein [Carboxylicivirga sp. M1479]TRX65771.1 lysophospholipid acyltransferase family protein [Carboxylicivirga sp. M1479]